MMSAGNLSDAELKIAWTRGCETAFVMLYCTREHLNQHVVPNIYI
jgi:hypothetical protein